MTAKRGHYAKGLARRDAIFQEILGLFSSLGYEGASLRGIARELDMSPGLIHHYFDSREALLIEVVTEWDRRNEELNAELGLDALDGMRASLASNVDVPGLVLLYSSLVVESSRPEHPSRTFVSERYDRLTKRLAESIAARMEEGRAPLTIDPESAAKLLIATIEGLQLRWLHDPSLNVEEQFDSLLAALGFSD